MSKAWLIIVWGLPCTGKTTLGQWLAKELNLPFVHKDGIKESLFESLGWKDRAWSKQLSYASIELLYYMAETQLAVGRSLVIESNFDPILATPQFRALKEKYELEFFQVHCQAPPEILFERHESRIASGERHPGHHTFSLDEFKAIVLSSTPQAMDIGGQVIELDTSDFSRVDYAGLLEAVRVATRR
ncbi:MAG: AAA family ATPase [Thermoflexales bacterium]|nr:AAA family ATPase [Thermoflexales bacterium]